MSAAVSKPSALDTLKALANKKPAPQAQSLAAQTQDPALIGAKLNKNTVTLGFDPGFAERVAFGASLKEALEKAESDFKIVQSELRDYGRDKRTLYNDAFKANVTTVCVPYEIDTPTGKEKKVVQVICSNKYSVQKDMVLGHEEKFGPAFDKLFEVERVKKLKPNAEDLIRGILTESGIEGEALDQAMDTLFEEEVKVATTEKFEAESKKVEDPDLRAVLDQAVTRSQPSLKFP